MRKLLFSAFALLFIAQQGLSCNVCGCSSTAFSGGVMPGYTIHGIGLFSGFSQYTTNNSLINDNISSSTDRFLQYGIQFNYALNPKLTLVGTLPMQTVFRTEDATPYQLTTIGDVSAQLAWQAINKTTTNWWHTLYLTAGLKAPTGAMEIGHSTFHQNLYAGSKQGSLTAGFDYFLKRNKIGLRAQALGSYAVVQLNDYHKGNSVRAGLLGVYWHELNNGLILFQGGPQIDFKSNDIWYDYTMPSSNKRALLLNLSADIYVNQTWRFFPSFSIPVAQNIADGMNQQHFAVEFTIQRLIQKKSNNEPISINN